MLGRYRIVRGARLASYPQRVQRGVRLDTRRHTRHVLRPTAAMVDAFLGAPAECRNRAWENFAHAYEALLEERFDADRSPFDALAELARRRDVFLGCSCPTARNPDVAHCHTVLALRFLQRSYPDLDVELP